MSGRKRDGETTHPSEQQAQTEASAEQAQTTPADVQDISAEEMAENPGILGELLDIVNRHVDTTKELKDASVAVVHEHMQDVLGQIEKIERPVVRVSIGELVTVKITYGFLHLLERHIARKVAAQKKTEEVGAPEQVAAPAAA